MLNSRLALKNIKYVMPSALLTMKMYPTRQKRNVSLRYHLMFHWINIFVGNIRDDLTTRLNNNCLVLFSRF